MVSFSAVGISKRFEGIQALKEGDLAFNGPAICGLVGANGSGKTTFSRICAGLVRRDSGEVWIDGVAVELNDPRDAGRLGIVLAHQNLSLVPELPVWQNILLGHERRRGGAFLRDREAMAIAKETLEDLVPGEIDPEAKVATLSPAHKQMVEIVKAISRKPRLLILDEPTAALKYDHVEYLFRKIRHLRDNGVSIIFISHRLWEITGLCDIVVAFRNGHMVGTVDFKSQPRDERLIVPLVTGELKEGPVLEKKVRKAFCTDEYAIELNEASSGAKVRNVSLAVRRGEILGIGGLNGQGQEELIRLMAGSLRLKSGRILLGGRTVRIRHPVQAMRRGVYLVPGDRIRDGLFMNHSIFTNVVFPLIALRRVGLFLRYKELLRTTDGAISATNLSPANRAMKVKNLSGGNQQKVVFGRWLGLTPKVLLLDDPAKGIDILAKQELYRHVQSLVNDGTSVVLYASSNEELVENCDRIVVMFEGSIVDEIVHDDICDEKLITSSLRIGGLK